MDTERAFNENEGFMRSVFRREASLLRKAYGTTAEDEDEMEQDALMDAYRRIPNFDPARSSLRTFLYSVVRNSTRWQFAHIRRHAQDRFEEGMARGMEDADAPSPEDGDFAMRILLESLPEDVAIYCRMRMDGHTDEDARAVLGVKRSFWTDFRRRVRESLRGAKNDSQK